jgi:hypothetical protein
MAENGRGDGPRFPLVPVLIGAGVVALGVILGIVLIGGDDSTPGNGGTTTPTGSSPTSEPTGTVTGGPTDQPTGEATDLPQSLGWRSLAQPSFGGAGIQTIVALSGTGGPDPEAGSLRFVAAGSDSSGGDPDAAVWVSVDGETWEAVEDDAFGGTGPQAIGGIHNTGRTLVAVGSDGAGGDSDAAVWVSDDARDWTRVVDDALGGPGDQEMIRVKGAQGLFVGVGYDASGGDQDAAVWVSDDALSWDLLVDEEVFGGIGDQVITRVQTSAFEDPGAPALIAVGHDSGADGDEDGALWVSDDGLDWQRVPDPDEVVGGDGPQQILDVAAFGGQMVAVGSDASGGDEDGAVWRSDDGVQWQRVSLPEEVVGGTGDQRITRVVTLEGEGDGFPAIVAGGSDGSGGDLDAAIWYSDTGLAWERDADPDGALGGTGNQVVLSIFSRGGPLFAVGSDADDAGAWITEP